MANRGAIDGFLFDPDATRQVALPPIAADNYWFDDPEIRIGDERQQGRSEQSYRLRFEPVLPGRRRDERTLMRSQLDYATSTREVAMGNTLRSRYALVLTYIGSLHTIAHLQRREFLNQAKLTATQELATSRRFDPTDVENAAHALAATRRQLTLTGTQLERIRTLLGTAETTTVGDLNWLLTPDDVIVEVLTRYPDADRNITLAQQRAKTAWDVARAELALARRESRFGVKFVELGYQDQMIDSSGLTVAFRIPFTRPSNHYADLLEVASAEAEYRAETTAAGLYVTSKTMALRASFESWQALGPERAVLEDKIAGSRDNPELLLVLSEQLLGLDAQRQGDHLNMLEDYIDLLAATGELQERPLRNRLSAGGLAR